MSRCHVKATARPERRRDVLGEYESESHHFSCSTGLLARRTWKEARGLVPLTSSDLHAEALTSGVGLVVASGTLSSVAGGPLVRVGSSLTVASFAGSPTVVSVARAGSVVAEVGSICVSSVLTALLGLRNRPPSF